jgi:N-acetylneuraminic acid mutarotase
MTSFHFACPAVHLACTLGLACTLSCSNESLEPSGQRENVTLQWEAPGPDSSTPRYEAQGLVVGHKLYVFGGFVQGSGWPVTADGEVFDLEARTWAPLGPAPLSLTHAGRATDGTYLYFAGGFVGDGPGGSTNRSFRYDPAGDAWQEVAPLPEERGAGALVHLGTKLHYFGGAVRPPDENTISSDHTDHWALDLTGPSAEWTRLAPLLHARNHLGGGVARGKIYAVGGQHLHDERAGNQASVEVYDSARDEWNEVASLPIPVGHLTSNTLEYEGRLLVISGVTQESTKLATIFSYDPEHDAWSELTPLPEQRHSPISAISENTLVVAGGSKSTAREIRAQTWIGTLSLD